MQSNQNSKKRTLNEHNQGRQRDNDLLFGNGG